ncbi:MAG TPA: hypothetical protein VKY73_13965 [Polyangiaceae bacterium]|nr:hypothetical protein [Polyangiaceae bacterium]
MRAEDLAVLKALVSVAGENARSSAAAHELIEELLHSSDPTPSQVGELREFARAPRSLHDLPVEEIGPVNRRVLLSQAVWLAVIDGEPRPRSTRRFERLSALLKIPTREAERIVAAAERQARRLLPLLERPLSVTFALPGCPSVRFP